MSSDLLGPAAEALGVPEALAQRSAQARAKADGVAVDDVLRSWAGGGAVATAARAPESPPEEAAVEPAEAEAPPQAQVEEAPPAPAVAAAAPPEPVPAALERTALADEPAPVLRGRRDSAFALIAGVLALLLLGGFFAFVLPALDATPAVPPASGYSAEGLRGREVYVREGCWYCHTQQVRPIVADAGLGPVTQAADLAPIAPDTLGMQRIGPDLAGAGDREPTNDFAWLVGFLENPTGVRRDSLQPGYGHLPQTDLEALARFILESQ